MKGSIDEDMQWVVFEPNNVPLWTGVLESVGNVLRLTWRSGALQGQKVEDAFLVKCDRATMTRADIHAGRLICHNDVALIKPAEFVISRIQAIPAMSLEFPKSTRFRGILDCRVGLRPPRNDDLAFRAKVSGMRARPPVAGFASSPRSNFGTQTGRNRPEAGKRSRPIRCSLASNRIAQSHLYHPSRKMYRMYCGGGGGSSIP